MNRKVVDAAFTVLFALQCVGTLVIFGVQQGVREAISAQYALFYAYVLVTYWLVPLIITYLLYSIVRYVESRSEDKDFLSSPSSRVAACTFGITVAINVAYVMYLQ